MTWERGRERVDELLARGELEEVTASEALADRLVREADKHLTAAGQIVAIDEAGAYQLAYDVARKACAALLAQQGLRATTRGGHVAVQDTVQAQFGGRGGMAAFGPIPRMRRKRAASEYPDMCHPHDDNRRGPGGDRERQRHPCCCERASGFRQRPPVPLTSTTACAEGILCAGAGTLIL